MISFSAQADEWPSRPIRFILPWGAGGITDTLTRMYNEKVSAAIGQPIVIEYKPGAAGRLGLGELGRSAPDGYSIGMANSGPLTIQPLLYAKMPFDPENSFTPLGLFAVSPMALAVPAASPVKTLDDLKALSQKRSLNFGTPGVGGPHHLTAEMLFQQGVNGIPVHFKNSGDIVAGMLNGTLDAYFDTVYQQAIYVQDGRYRAIAVTSAKRMPALPDTPTFAEIGLPAFNIESFYAVVAPAKLPAPIATRLADAYADAARSPDIVEYLDKMSLTNKVLPPPELAAFFRDVRMRWKRVIDERGLKIE